MRAYYNEFDPKAAAWLRELMKAGVITDGVVDERSIVDVAPADLVGFDRCHFFAGIGGWDHALTLAGWGERPVWTGSCPCQPFSTAGKRKGFDDERHLWPAFFRLIRECRPHVVFGEQVASALGWLDAVCADLEGEGYACGAAIVGAHSVGAPHIRQRLYWVADRDGARCGPGRDGEPSDGRGAARVELAGLRPTHRLADADGGESGDRGLQPGRQHGLEPEDGGARGVGDTDEPGPQGRGGTERGQFDQDGQASPSGTAIRMGHANSGGRGQDDRQPGECGAPDGGEAPDRRGWRGDTHPWADLAWLPCRDGKARPTQPGLFPLAHGVSGRVGLLRGAGNAIVPQVAAAFIQAYRGE